jgi:hypothetical protein
MQIDIKDAIRFALQSVIDCGGMHPKQEGRELTIWDHWIGTQKISDIYFLSVWIMYTLRPRWKYHFGFLTTLRNRVQLTLTSRPVTSLSTSACRAC